MNEFLPSKAQHTSISVLDTMRVTFFLILTYAGRVICEHNSDVTVMQQLCHNSITVMSLWRIGDDFWTISSSQIKHENVTVTWQWRHWNELWCHWREFSITLAYSPPCIPSSALFCLDRFPFAELRYAVATLFFWGIQRGSGNFFASKVTEA